LDFTSIIIILFGSTFGLITRIFIQKNLKINIGFDIQNTSIVNFLSSFFLGILVALNFINNEILVLFYSGFLGCLSTFSSFIYQLFILFKERKFLKLFFHYIEVIIFSFLFFYLGYLIIQFFKVKINNFIYIILAAYFATFLRLTINNNFLISIIGSFLVGFFINKKLSYSIKKILLSGFFSCFTSFSGFIYFLYKIINQGDWIKFIIFFNLIIIVNLFTMFIGFWISRKIN